VPIEAGALRSNGASCLAVTPDPATPLLLVAFGVIAVALSFPDVSRLRTSVAGNSGDALLNLWIMRSAQIGLPHGWHAFWNAGIFHPFPNTLAYSDTLLPAALLHWVLRLGLDDALALNAIYLGSWVLSSWCGYRLARRVVAYWGAAFVAALAYTYSAIRLAHHGHLQLVIGGALVPLVLLALLRLLECPSLRRGIALGSAFSALTLTSSYYGAMTSILILIVGGGWMLTQRPAVNRQQLRALAVAVLIAGVLVAPVAVKYIQLQHDANFRRRFEPSEAAHLTDFLATADSSYVTGRLPVTSRFSPSSRSVENRLFPGLVALGFGTVGMVVIAGEVRRKGRAAGRHRELVLSGVAGACVSILAFGDWFAVGGHRIWLPFAVFRHFVPGFAGMRAVSRLALGGELALALFAAVGLDAVVAHRRSLVKAGTVAAVAIVVVIESAAGLQFVQVPTQRDDGGVSRALRSRPRGPVLELPLSTAGTSFYSPSGGASTAFVEAPRQLVAVHDGNPRVNGYSGFEPPGFEAEARTLNQFPAGAAVAEAERLGVRYVVLRTSLVGVVTPNAVTDRLNRDGVGRYSDTTARAMLSRLVPTTAVYVEALAGGHLIELRSTSS
jgi:hypothetical protein